MFEPADYNVVREGIKIMLKKNNKEELATIFVDATDNRLTVMSMDENIPLEAVKRLTSYLDENFGAKQIFILPESVREKFAVFGFKSVNPENDRIRATSFEALAGIKSEQFPELQFVQGEIIKSISKENIEALAIGSNFLQSKITQYKEQGYSGFQLMCDYSMPFGIMDSSDKLVAFCRVTDIGKGNYYLGDTFVDEKAFGDKQKGTAYLYQQLGKQFGAGSVLLIAPPGRVEEFEKQYGCKAPDNVMFKFGGPEPELNIVLKEEKERIEGKLQQTNTRGFDKK